VTGLAIASDIGILMHTVVLAWLLHRKKMVLLSELPWLELTKALVTAVFAGAASYEVARSFSLRGGRGADVISLVAVSLTWLAAGALGLWITRSNLPRDLRRKKASATNVIPEQVLDSAEP
jgi:putative peptidoglycan lipid II flippase